MAQISIIADDKMVVKDGAGISGLTLSSLPADVWAVQWNSTTSKGTVEKRDWSVTEITELGIYQTCVDEYETAKSKIPTPSTLSAEDRFREARHQRLASSDWTQSSDSPLSADKKKEWATYRQALRDLPQNESDFSKIELPEEPS